MPTWADIGAEVLLLRHGHTAANEKHQYCGRSDLPLSVSGRRQTAALRDWLHASRIWPSGRTVVVSPLQRCLETAAILWPDQAPIPDPAFIEADFGEWEGQTWNDLQNDPHYRAWIDADLLSDLAPPAGESRLAVNRRVLDGFARLIARFPAEQLAIVTHGGVIMTLLSALIDTPAAGRERFYRWQCPPATGFVLSAGRKIRAVPTPPAEEQLITK